MNQSEALEPIDGDDDDRLTHVSAGAMGAIVRSEVEAQLDAAHKYPRSISKFLKEALALATISQDVAESCLYAMPRDGKMIAGPSVRLAEICASAYGNLHFGARIVDEEDKVITAQGGAWDLEKNTRVTVETRRRITGKNGRRYSDDMVVVTGNAAASIAMRNAIFRVVPRSYVMQIYSRVKEVAVGNASTLTARRATVLERLQKIGVPTDRVLAKLEKKGIDDIGLDDLEILIGLGSSIKNGEAQIDDVFPMAAPPPAAAADEGKRVKLGGTKKEAPPEGREPGSDG